MAELAPTVKITKAQADGMADALILAYWYIYPFRKWPDIKPMADLLESLFDRVDPKWREAIPEEKEKEATAEGFPELGALPLLFFLVPLKAKLSTWLLVGGVAAVAAAAGIAAKANKEGKKVDEKIREWKPGEPFPIKDPDGRMPDPWFADVIKGGILASAAALVVAHGISKVVGVIPEAPKEWFQYLVAGGVAIGAWWLWLRRKKKKRR